MFRVRPHQGRFTSEQMIEISNVKARLEAIKNKCQPYPAELAPEPGKPALPEPQWSMEQWQYAQQSRGMVNHLQNKLAEHLQPKRKPQQKRNLKVIE